MLLTFRVRRNSSKRSHKKDKVSLLWKSKIRRLGLPRKRLLGKISLMRFERLQFKGRSLAPLKILLAERWKWIKIIVHPQTSYTLRKMLLKQPILVKLLANHLRRWNKTGSQRGVTRRKAGRITPESLSKTMKHSHLLQANLKNWTFMAKMRTYICRQLDRL